LQSAGCWNRTRLATLGTLVLLAGCAGVRQRSGPPGQGGNGAGPSLPCVDLDGDGYGPNCLLGPDCNDRDRTSHDNCTGTIIIDPGWVPRPDAGAPDVYVPPVTETPTCPAGTRRIHVKDVWSKEIDPTLGVTSSPPLAVVISDVTHNWLVHNARKDAAGCAWYSDCLPTTAAKVTIADVDPATGCVGNPTSGNIDISQHPSTSTSDLYIDYGGSSATLPADYNRGNLRVTDDPAAAGIAVCPPGQPDTSTPAGFTKIHFRWPWADPRKTGFPGTACEAQKGDPTPPYPSSLAVNAGGGVCVQPLLEFEDGHCPWYSILIPNSKWVAGATFQAAYPDFTGLQSAALTLPARTADELWVGYAGPPDTPACLNYGTRPDSYRWYTTNPGPGYAGCGGDGSVPIDPCNPTPPTGTSVVHFRYIWAGQKTFTFFPKPDFMPLWIILEVTNPTTTQNVTCWREADRPWFNCPVPNEFFGPGCTWRAVDKTRTPTEWNTVTPRPMPTTAAEYWLRWYYGKPDTPVPTGFKGASKQTDQFQFFDYYPDGSDGDWSATGSWNDKSCKPKPPPTVPQIGFGGWFPYARTSYSYPFGTSLAKTYSDAATVQTLFNVLVFERYNIWKRNYVTTDDHVCGTGTARVTTDPPGTVSEGQGYGIAMAAAIGDKQLFDQLWNFVRHYLSQSSKKYCGGLMGWMWDDSATCRPLDTPCDPDSGAGCGGNGDSTFDGDVDIGIGLVFAARQWPEYTAAAVGWLLKMECEVNSAYDGKWNYPAPGDTFDKNCAGYPGQACTYTPGFNGRVNMSYYPPGYFRAFGDFLSASLDPADYTAAERTGHHAFWYKTAQTVWEMSERCYDQTSVNPALVTDWGHYDTPCDANADNYNWSRALWRLAIDAAWFGDRADLPENAAGSSPHYSGKTRLEARMDNIQGFYARFSQNNPVETNANRFSSICQNLQPDGAATACDPGYGHNSYFVNTAMCSYANLWDDGRATTPAIRREAIEEAVTTTIENDRYYQESIGVYTLMFLTGNFPNPMAVPP
jgi:endo-1,4-beta-D-glucanase Y